MVSGLLDATATFDTALAARTGDRAGPSRNPVAGDLWTPYRVGCGLIWEEIVDLAAGPCTSAAKH